MSDNEYFRARESRGGIMSILDWERDTWKGVATVVAGMLIQAGLGIVSIWGNIVVYVASKLREADK
jgi:hypothetical protein